MFFRRRRHDNDLSWRRKQSLLARSCSPFIAMTTSHGCLELIFSVFWQAADTLYWLPVTARIQFKIAALTFDCVRGTGPVYLKQVICPVSDLSRRSLLSADRGNLFVSRANTSIGQRSFSIAAPVVWNALPPDLRSPHNSRQQFRSKLKTHLFRQAYTAWFLWEHCWRV